MNISIIGCKYFNDYQVLKWHLDDINITQITTCGNEEIDKMAGRYAEENNIKLKVLWPPKDEGWIYLWKEYYRLVESCNVLLAFWFGESHSVESMVKKAKNMGKEVILIRGYHSESTKSSNNQPTYQNHISLQSPPTHLHKTGNQPQENNQHQTSHSSVMR